MRVAVFGLGYVGCVSAGCLARDGHRVVGVDVKPGKVEALNRGEPTVSELGLGKVVREAVDEGRLSATEDAEAAVRASEVSLLCVGTPSRESGGIDLSYLERVCEHIGEALAPAGPSHTVVVRSTVLPGTTEERLVPILEAASGRTVGEELDVAVNPEFLREGSSLRDYYDPPFTIVGASSNEVTERVAFLYPELDAPTFSLPVREAEMVKYACNAFHAVKVSFANEIGNLCKEFGADSHRVMKAFCADRKLNISPAYLTPGFAFGGSCLPKDLRALTHAARHRDIETHVLEATLETNRQQIERAAQMVLATGSRRVGVLGLAFKEGTDDLRESPMVALVERLLGKGLKLRVYDPAVREGVVVGTNREFVEARIPHIWELLEDDLKTVVTTSETLVVGRAFPEMRAMDGELLDGRHVVDLVRWEGRSGADEGTYEGICW